MKTLPLFVLFVASSVAVAQTPGAQLFEREGFFIGAAVGGGVVTMSGSGVQDGTASSASFPNFRVGYMISDRTALVLLLPGTIYRYEGVDGMERPRDRGFEGVVPSVQHWVGDRWWVMGGVGLALDSPAFYDVRGSDEGSFYVGPSISAASGYEVWRGRRSAVDAQGTARYGLVYLPGDEQRKGLVFGVLIGFTLY